MLWSHQWTNTTPSSFARLICWISMLSYNSSLVCYRAHHAPYPNKQQTNHLTNLPYQVPHQPSCQKLDTTRIVPTASVAVPIIHTMSLYSVSNTGCFSIAFVKLNIQMDLSVNRWKSRYYDASETKIGIMKQHDCKMLIHEVQSRGIIGLRVVSDK